MAGTNGDTGSAFKLLTTQPLQALPVESRAILALLSHFQGDEKTDSRESIGLVIGKWRTGVKGKVTP